MRRATLALSSGERGVCLSAPQCGAGALVDVLLGAFLGHGPSLLSDTPLGCMSQCTVYPIGVLVKQRADRRRQSACAGASVPAHAGAADVRCCGEPIGGHHGTAPRDHTPDPAPLEGVDAPPRSSATRATPAWAPRAGWTAHGSVEESRQVIREVLAVPESYAIVLQAARGGPSRGRDCPHVWRDVRARAVEPGGGAGLLGRPAPLGAGPRARGGRGPARARLLRPAPRPRSGRATTRATSRAGACRRSSASSPSASSSRCPGRASATRYAALDCERWTQVRHTHRGLIDEQQAEKRDIIGSRDLVAIVRSGGQTGADPRRARRRARDGRRPWRLVPGGRPRGGPPRRARPARPLPGAPGDAERGLHPAHGLERARLPRDAHRVPGRARAQERHRGHGRLRPRIRASRARGRGRGRRTARTGVARGRRPRAHAQRGGGRRASKAPQVYDVTREVVRSLLA